MNHLALGTALTQPPGSITPAIGHNHNGSVLVALRTHGHRLLARIVFGATGFWDRHRVTEAVLLLRAK